jgi:hypothetical protein
MAVTINGDGVVDVGGNSSSAAKVRLYEDTDNGTNYIDLIAPASVTSNQVLTLPNATATVAFDGPAFSAYQSSAQTLNATTYTKLNFQTEEYDTNSNFDTSNSRFTPTVAGYYLCTGSFEITTTQATLVLQVYKNGASSKLLGYSAGIGNAVAGSAVIYMNGSTDYLELYGYSTAGNGVNASSLATFFQATLVRAA